MRTLLLIPLLMLTGCGMFNKTIAVTAEVETLPFIHPAPVQSMNMKEVKFTILNDDLLSELSDNAQGTDIAIWAMTAQHYENLAENMQEIIRYIKQQKAVIEYYRNAVTKEENENEEVD